MPVVLVEELEELLDQSSVVEALVKQGNAGRNEQREKLAMAYFDQALIQVGKWDILLCLRPGSLFPGTRTAAREIAKCDPVEEMSFVVCHGLAKG